MSIPNFEFKGGNLTQGEFLKFWPPKRQPYTHSNISFLMRLYARLDHLDARLERIKRQYTCDNKLASPPLTQEQVFRRNQKAGTRKSCKPLLLRDWIDEMPVDEKGELPGFFAEICSKPRIP